MRWRAADEADEPKEDNSADDRTDKAADNARRVNAEEAEKPAAEHTADDTDHKIDYEAETSASHKLAGYKSSHKTYKYKPNKWHNELYLIM